MSPSNFLPYPRHVCGLAVLAIGLCARAQENIPASLTLDAALARAVERSPVLAAQRHAERAADALIEQAGLRPNPQLQAELENFAGTGGVQAIRRLETTLQASQVLERGEKRERRVAVATRERDTAVSELAVRRGEVLAAVAGAFVEVAAAQQRVALAAEPLTLARDTVAAVDARVRAGVASAADAARAKAALATAQGDSVRVEAALAAARARLAATWGGGAAEISLVTGVVRIPEAGPDEATLLGQVARHPRLALRQTQIAARRAALELEQAQAVQDVTVAGGLRFLREGTDTGFVAGVSVPLPVRNRNQGNIRAARENLAGAEQSVRMVEAELRSEFIAAWQELIAAHASAQNLRRDVLPATEQAHAAVRSAYQQGAMPLLEVLDAQRALVAVRRDILEAESAYAAAFVRISALTDPGFSSLTAMLAQP